MSVRRTDCSTTKAKVASYLASSALAGYNRRLLTPLHYPTGYSHIRVLLRDLSLIEYVKLGQSQPIEAA